MVFSLAVLDQCDSTNEELSRLPPDDWHGRAVLALRQQSGQGRRGRAWHHGEGGLALSIGVRVARDQEWRGALLPFLLGLAVVETLEMRAKSKGLDSAELRLKWPNDIYFEGKKMGGILGQSRPVSEGSKAFILGLGLNLKGLPSDLAHETYGTATWLESGDAVEPQEIGSQILESFAEQLDFHKASDSVAEQWWRAAKFSEKETWLALQEGNEPMEVVPLALLPSGALLVRSGANGAPRELWADEITFRREQADR
jgi:BirA family transcriptional regulator, biotin operon repressor / biotin---[acetyl-CoA-carboxylase] ligase